MATRCSRLAGIIPMFRFRPSHLFDGSSTGSQSRQFRVISVELGFEQRPFGVGGWPSKIATYMDGSIATPSGAASKAEINDPERCPPTPGMDYAQACLGGGWRLDGSLG
jgi:hypothetical protein